MRTQRAGLLGTRRGFFVAAVAASFLAGGCGGGDDTPVPTDPVIIFTSADKIKAQTNTATVVVRSLFSRALGSILLNEGTEGSIVRIASGGTASIFARESSIFNVTKLRPVALGPFDEILDGDHQGHVVAADATTGFLIRLTDLGGVRLHADPAEIALIAGTLDPRMSLPRDLATNEVISQELDTKKVLLIGNAGNVQEFASEAQIAAAAGGIPVSDATISGWVRGGGTGTQFARFALSNNIAIVPITGGDTVKTHVEGTTFAALFPLITGLQIHDFVAGPATDELIVLVGDGVRGLALAFIEDDALASASVFTSAADLAAVAGAGYDISDLIVFANGTVLAVDRGGAQILRFDEVGAPTVFRTKAEIAAASGVADPVLSIGTPLGITALVFPEATSGHLLRTN